MISSALLKVNREISASWLGDDHGQFVAYRLSRYLTEESGMTKRISSVISRS